MADGRVAREGVRPRPGRRRDGVRPRARRRRPRQRGRLARAGDARVRRRAADGAAHRGPRRGDRRGRARGGAEVRLRPDPRRAARLAEIEALDPRRDHREIFRRSAMSELAWEMRFGWNLAFYRAFAVPRMAGLLVRSGELTGRPVKRAYDTGLLMYELFEHGVDHPRGREVIRVLNRMHRRWDIADDDYRYILAAFAVVPERFAAAHGWRPLGDVEREAAYRVMHEIGTRMSIPGIPASFDALAAYLDEYEAREVRHSAAAAGADGGDAAVRRRAAAGPAATAGGGGHRGVPRRPAARGARAAGAAAHDPRPARRRAGRTPCRGAPDAAGGGLVHRGDAERGVPARATRSPTSARRAPTRRARGRRSLRPGAPVASDGAGVVAVLEAAHAAGQLDDLPHRLEPLRRQAGGAHRDLPDAGVAQRREEVELGVDPGRRAVVEEVGGGDAEERRERLDVALGRVVLDAGAELVEVAGRDRGAAAGRRSPWRPRGSCTRRGPAGARCGTGGPAVLRTCRRPSATAFPGGSHGGPPPRSCHTAAKC